MNLYHQSNVSYRYIIYEYLPSIFYSYTIVCLLIISMDKFYFNLSLYLLLLSQVINLIIPETNNISRLIWYLWIFICILYAAKICLVRNSIKKNYFAIILLIFWIINAISYFNSDKVISSYLVSVNTIEIFKSSTIALFSYFPFYYFSKNNIIDVSKMKKFAIILFLIYIVVFINARIIASIDSLGEDSTLNQSYNFILLLPLLMLFTKRNLMLVFVFATIFFVIYGSKRGAILCLLLELLLYLSYIFKKDSYGKKHRFLMFITIILILIISFYYLLGNEYLMERLLNTGSDADTSGDIRKQRYEILFRRFFDSDFYHILFGYGYASSITISGGLAHQDWTEILINNGLFGIIPYLLLLLLAVKKSKYLCNFDIVRYAYYCCILIWVSKASFSMVYTSRRAFILFLSIGIIQGLSDSINNNNLYLNLNKNEY